MKAQTRLRVAYKLLASSIAEHSRLIHDLPLVIKEPRIVYKGQYWRINGYAYHMTANEIIGLWDARNRAICERMDTLNSGPEGEEWQR